MVENTTITLPAELKQKAKEKGINLSEITAIAITQQLEKDKPQETPEKNKTFDTLTLCFICKQRKICRHYSGSFGGSNVCQACDVWLKTNRAMKAYKKQEEQKQDVNIQPEKAQEKLPNQ